MTSRLQASMIVIGDEILDGHTRDTNSGWVAARLSEAGVVLERIVTVPDSMEAIDEVLHLELSRPRPRLVLTSGGIGSTPDDLTVAAVAAHVGVATVPDPTLDARIDEWAGRAAIEDAPIPAGQQQAMRKMALVPDGAYLLPGARGLTPGVALDVDGGLAAGGATVVILPGVPGELQRIVEEGVLGLMEGFADPPHLVELRHPYPESTLSPLLGELTARYPEVHIGSYPGRECLLRIKGEESMVVEVAEQLTRHLDTLATDGLAQRMSARWQARWE